MNKKIVLVALLVTSLILPRLILPRQVFGKEFHFGIISAIEEKIDKLKEKKRIGREYVDDFSIDTALWTYWGSAYRDGNNEYVVLTQPLDSQSGIIWLNDEFTDSFSVRFRYKVGGGSGADGFVFMFYKSKDYEPSDGGSLAFNDKTPAPGYGIEFDGWQNFEDTPPDPSANHIALIKDWSGNHLVYVNDARTEDNQWHQVRVTVDSNRVDVEVDGGQVLSWQGDIDRTFGGVGFGAATGFANNWHIIDDVHISLL